MHDIKIRGFELVIQPAANFTQHAMLNPVPGYLLQTSVAHCGKEIG